MGYVVGDPKCTPFLNERADMGFTENGISARTDDKGIPYISIGLMNKGNKEVTDGLVELFIENDPIWQDKIDIPANGEIVLNISSEDEPIIGTYHFMVRLNGDESIWEFDPNNNLLERFMTVNSIPKMEISIDNQQIFRTERFNITVLIEDEDSDISFEGLVLEIRSSIETIYVPELVGEDESSNSRTYHLEFIPPWDSPLGFYSVWGRYDDPNGSFSEVLLFSSFKVLNNAPVLQGEIPIIETPRSEPFRVNLSWYDPDTPDGDLDLEVYVSRPISGRIEPGYINLTSNHSAEYLFDIPVSELSGTWTISASATDRDGSVILWEDTIDKFNELPEMNIINGSGAEITRLEDYSFEVTYSDPEGRAATEIDLKVYGPIASGPDQIVLERELAMDDGEVRSLTPSVRNLAVGDYSLIADFIDDDRGAGQLMVEPLFRIIPLAPTISSPVIYHSDGEGPPGDLFVKGSSISIGIPIDDPDTLGRPLFTSAVLGLPDGTERELPLEHKGDGIYRTRIQTDGTWAVGVHSLDLKVSDADGMNDSLRVDSLFTLIADFPILEEAKVDIALNGSYSMEVSLGVLSSSSIPSSVKVFLFNGNGTTISEIQLQQAAGFGLWTAKGVIEGIPANGSVMIVDDLGRIMWANGTVIIDLEEETESPEKTEDPDEEADPMVMIMAAIILVMILLILVLLVLVIRRNREASMKAPPPMGHHLPAPSIHSGLPVSEKARLPPGAANRETGSGPNLPPGRYLETGDSYHHPSLDKTPQVKEDKEKVIEMSEEEEEVDVPHQAPEPLKEDMDEIPAAPEPILEDRDKIPSETQIPEPPEEGEDGSSVNL
jgi:hypothetical protein